MTDTPSDDERDPEQTLDSDSTAGDDTETPPEGGRIQADRPFDVGTETDEGTESPQTDLMSGGIPVLRTSLSGLLTLLAPSFLVFYLLAVVLTVAVSQFGGGLQQVVSTPRGVAVFAVANQFLLWGCVRRLVVDERGESFDVGDVRTVLLRTPLVLLTAAVVLGVTGLIGGAAAALPFFIFPPLAVLLFSLLVLWVTIRFSLAGHAMVGDSLGPGQALNRSRDITAGHRWEILLILGLFMLLYSPFQFGIQFVSGAPLLPLLLGSVFVRFGLYLTLTKVYLHVNDGLTVR